MTPTPDDISRGVRHLTKLLVRDVLTYIQAVEAHLRDYGDRGAFGGKVEIQVEPQPGRRAEPKERR